MRELQDRDTLWRALGPEQAARVGHSQQSRTCSSETSKEATCQAIPEHQGWKEVWEPLTLSPHCAHEITRAKDSPEGIGPQAWLSGWPTSLISPQIRDGTRVCSGKG